jgi:hypothetical protein
MNEHSNDSMALVSMRSPPFLMMNSTKSELGVYLDIIDEIHAPFPWDLIVS